MPRHHFDLRDGDAFVLDEEGTELPDIESAQMEAAGFLSDTVNELTMRRSDPSGHSPWPLRFGSRNGLYFYLSFSVARTGSPRSGWDGRIKCWLNLLRWGGRKFEGSP